MPLPQPPNDIPIQHHSVWSAAATDGYKCSSSGGFQEQNPYDIESPLFEAWRTGWFEGVYATPLHLLYQRAEKVPSNLPATLNLAWRKRCREFFNRRIEKAKAAEVVNDT